jgi:hypothetical protein
MRGTGTRPPRAGSTATGGHIAADPDSEIVTATAVTAANTGDADPAEQLLADDLPAPRADEDGHHDDDSGSGDPGADVPEAGEHCDRGAANPTIAPHPASGGGAESVAAQSLAVYGDASYGAGPLLGTLEKAGARIMTKVQAPNAPGGRFAKDRFTIDLSAGTVTCPGRVIVPIRSAKGGGGTAAFGVACAGCPLVAQCTSAAGGRTITISAYEQQLARARAAQADPAWQADYTATRPKVERKIGHLMRRRHGGRRARVRGMAKVAADFSLLAAAVNLARLGMLGLRHTGPCWAAATT